ncbi:hypothetical protein COOONC_23830 [Cooperia oncophora]
MSQPAGGTVDYSAFLKRHLKMSNVLNDRHIKYTAEELKDVIKCSMELLKLENTLAEINPPIVIVGDIHGQLLGKLTALLTSIKK